MWGNVRVPCNGTGSACPSPENPARDWGPHTCPRQSTKATKTGASGNWHAKHCSIPRGTSKQPVPKTNYHGLEQISDPRENSEHKDPLVQPWLVWLSGLSAGLRTKGLQFNSQSEHMPGLHARSPVEGTGEATPHCCFSPSLSLPFSSKNK